MRGIPTAEVEKHAEIGQLLLTRETIERDLGMRSTAEEQSYSLEYVERHLAWILKYCDETEPKEELARAKEELSRVIALLKTYRKNGIPKAEQLQ